MFRGPANADVHKAPPIVPIVADRRWRALILKSGDGCDGLIAAKATSAQGYVGMESTAQAEMTFPCVESRDPSRWPQVLANGTSQLGRAGKSSFQHNVYKPSGRGDIAFLSSATFRMDQAPHITASMSPRLKDAIAEERRTATFKGTGSFSSTLPRFKPDGSDLGDSTGLASCVSREDHHFVIANRMSTPRTPRLAEVATQRRSEPTRQEIRPRSCASAATTVHSFGFSGTFHPRLF